MLEIDPRCIKCGKLPAPNAPLLEMHNHLYICNNCRWEEEQKGKRIAWTGGVQMESLTEPATFQLPASTTGVPRNSLFGILDVALDASLPQIENALGEKMRFWMFQPDSEEKGLMIERLRTWQEEIVSDPRFIEKQHAAVRPLQPKGSALTVGGRQVYNAREFVEACEACKEGWRDGEQLLRKGELQHWILFQLENRGLASEVNRLARADIPDFRALNYILYRLAPLRPFRLYTQEAWEPPSQTPSASTPAELAKLCDSYWECGEHHLYNGAMLSWLEYSQNCQGLSEYYRTFVKGYEYDRSNRGLGLELLLEQAVPSLPRPHLVVTFDGVENQCTLQQWDREIPHKPITVQIQNTTRGFSSITLEVIKSHPTEPEWLHLQGSYPVLSSAIAPSSAGGLDTQPPMSASSRTTFAVPISGRSGAGLPAHKSISMIDLTTLKRGKTYHQTLRLTERREYGKQSVVRQYPITLTTMNSFQGFLGQLWRWGLRGDFPGLIWNFAAGSALAFAALLLIPTLISPVYASWHSRSLSGSNLAALIEVSAAGSVDLLHRLDLAFVLAVGLIAGIIGLFTGFGKGHTSYTERYGARTFRRAAFWAMLPGLFILPIWGSIVTTIGGSLLLWGGSLLVALLAFLLLCAVSIIRSQLEKSLRTRYATLLNPPEKELSNDA